MINFIPLLSGVLGAVLGIVSFYAVPSIMPTDNVFHAILFGLFSGLSATGSENLVLQLKQFVSLKKDLTTNTSNIDVKNESLSIEQGKTNPLENGNKNITANNGEKDFDVSGIENKSINDKK